MKGDVCDRGALKGVFASFEPEIVFHLAAQSLVRRSYEDPTTTFETNTIGSMNVLECIRNQSSIRVGIIITSDKCYENVEWIWGYRENDRLGGDDPYSASKACAELVCTAYIRSYFQGDGPKVATARAGNVIGGGDWADGRILPDCVRSWSAGRPVTIRNPQSTRPWQHVLEPLSGYLWLGSNLWHGNDSVTNESFNFGPDVKLHQSVGELIAALAKYWPTAEWEIEASGKEEKQESKLLRLSCDKALLLLGWHAVLPFEVTVQFAIQWYQTYYRDGPGPMMDFTRRQIAEYVKRAETEGLSWLK